MISAFVPRVAPHVMHDKSQAMEAVRRLRERHRYMEQREEARRLSLEKMNQLQTYPSTPPGEARVAEVSMDLEASLGNDTIGYESLSQITSVPALQPRPLSSAMRREAGERGDYEKRKSTGRAQQGDFVWEKAKAAGRKERTRPYF